MLREEIAQAADTLAIWVGRATEARQEITTLHARITLTRPLLSRALVLLADSSNDEATKLIVDARKALDGR